MHRIATTIIRTVAAAALTVPALLLTGTGTAFAHEPDLWACTAEERADMGVPRGQDCYRTGAELDAEGWVDVSDEGELGDYVDSFAPSWASGTGDSGAVRRDENGLPCFCGGDQF